jgi:hypothetical protein
VCASRARPQTGPRAGEQRESAHRGARTPARTRPRPGRRGRRTAASTMAASEGVTPASRFARTPREPNFREPAPERSRVHPFAFARLQIARMGISGASLQALHQRDKHSYDDRFSTGPSSRKALPRRAGSREPREPKLVNPAPHGAARGRGSTRSPSRACEWPCLRRLCWRPIPGDKSECLRGLGQALISLAQAREGRVRLGSTTTALHSG